MIYLHLTDAGWSSPVAREAHNLEVVGSNPAPATCCRFSANRAFRKLEAFLLDYHAQAVLLQTPRYRVRLRRARGGIQRANPCDRLASHPLTTSRITVKSFGIGKRPAVPGMTNSRFSFQNNQCDQSGIRNVYDTTLPPRDPDYLTALK